jgi:hypothetical protein
MLQHNQHPADSRQHCTTKSAGCPYNATEHEAFLQTPDLLAKHHEAGIEVG